MGLFEDHDPFFRNHPPGEVTQQITEGSLPRGPQHLSGLGEGFSPRLTKKHAPIQAAATVKLVAFFSAQRKLL